MSIELVVPVWREGNEKDFFKFISEIDESCKVALISHTDLDGVSSAKIISQVIPADYLRFVDYQEINLDLVKELLDLQISHVIFSDLNLPSLEIVTELEKFSKVLIIDHHSSKFAFKSDKSVLMNSEGFCGAYLSYYLFSKVQDISKLDWLVACACLGDWCWKKPDEWLIKVFEKYGSKFIGEDREVKRNVFWENAEIISRALIYYGDVKKVYSSIGEKFGELDSLIDASNDIKEDIEECKQNFEKNKIAFKDGWFYQARSRYPIKSLVINELSLDYHPNSTIILGDISEDHLFFKLSARRQDGKVDVAKFLSELVRGLDKSSGGGHPKAAGASCLIKDREEVLRRLGIENTQI